MPKGRGGGKGRQGTNLFRKGMGGGGGGGRRKKPVGGRRPKPVLRRPKRKPIHKVSRRFKVRQGMRVICKIIRGVAEYMYVPEDYEVGGDYEEIEGVYY